MFVEESGCWLCLERGEYARAYVFDARPKSPGSKSLDHVVPRSRGGAVLDRRNCRLAHLGCNSSRQADELDGGGEPQSEVW